MDDRGFLTFQGRVVPEPLIGPLTGTDDPEAWRQNLERHGWLLLRGALDPDEVQAAREETLAHLTEVDEIEPPATVGLATGRSRRRERHPDLGAFWGKVSTGEALRRACRGLAAQGLIDRLMGSPWRALDFLWLRVKAQGIGGPLRQGITLLGGDEPALVTWVPLGTIEFHQGPVFVVADSHRSPAVPGKDPPKLDLDPGARTRLLTARFEPGDVLVLHGRTVYGAFDNDGPHRRVRVSCEGLWRPASAAADPRFEGPSPPGPDGRGYGGLPSALPLTEQARPRA